MSDLNQAALMLAGATAAFLLLAFAIWRSRRPQPEPAAPAKSKTPHPARESRLPKLSRKAEARFEPVEIAPARLARIRGRSQADIAARTDEAGGEEPRNLAIEEPPIDDTPIRDAAPLTSVQLEPETDVVSAPPALDEAALDALALQVERQAQTEQGLAAVPGDVGPALRLIPQIPPRDAIMRTSWLGGRPRLPGTIEWPKIDGRDADFIAQIACADLPPALWNGLGPRTGWLAFFANPDNGEAIALHLAEDGPPRDAPRAIGPAYFRPHGIDTAVLSALAIRALPEWPVDIVTSDDAIPPAEAVEALLAADYDIADPAFHPFDWSTMLAMAGILEDRVLSLPNDIDTPEDASDELAQAAEDAAKANRDAAERLREIIAIIRESASAGSHFAPSDATAVMAALHAIRWSRVSAHPDPEGGEDRVETLALPLTRRRPDGDLWTGAYRNLLFDHARHAYCANPDRLSAPARGFFEPLWQAMAAAGVASIGGIPSRPAAGFDPERDATMLELLPNALLGLAQRDGASIILALRKADLATGEFSKIRALAGG